MIKRCFDLVCSILGLTVVAPVLGVSMFLIWRQDGFSPLFVASRVGINETLFKMIKLRSMIKDANKTGVDSTGANDKRITPIGHFVRKYKLDELTQLANVFLGEMSLVGPRPNVKAETDLYSSEEKKLLTVRPGITDFASIIFSDEGDILQDAQDPDLAYNQLIRPWKSRLGIIYIENRSFFLDIKLIVFTLVAIISRASALRLVIAELTRMNCPEKVIDVCRRDKPLEPTPPPGFNEVVTSRDV